jgi:ubiquinone/menaquinone biosynthesis C-methylase UbiE
MKLDEQLERMKHDWDRRARENARHFVDTSRKDWTDQTFFASGEQAIAEDVLTDTINIYQGRDPARMRVLEIGCGAGRLTRALSNIFGEIHAVDVSGEMVARARTALHDRPHVTLYQNNGCDLTVVPPLVFDFAYSSHVFQHIPSREVIDTYVREVHRLLRPGALFKFQVQGHPSKDSSPGDTWHGVSFTPEQATAMAQRCGFEHRHSYGQGHQYFWLWFFKPPA